MSRLPLAERIYDLHEPFPLLMCSNCWKCTGAQAKRCIATEAERLLKLIELLAAPWPTASELQSCRIMGEGVLGLIGPCFSNVDPPFWCIYKGCDKDVVDSPMKFFPFLRLSPMLSYFSVDIALLWSETHP